MSRRELEDHFAWFMNIIPERVRELEAEVQGTPPTEQRLGSYRSYEPWRADLSVDSLNSLGAWFVSQVTLRPRTPEEIENVKRSLTIPIEVPTETLADRTLSIASDIGMYLGKVLLEHRPQLSWKLQWGSKNNVDYGRPVLDGFTTGVPMNPVRIAVVLAQAIASKNRGPERLRELYEVWAKNA